MGEPLLACLMLGMLAGGAWGFLRRPTPLHSAMEADAQLRLSDLLGSAMLIRASATSDPWSAAVLASADRRCADLQPSTVLLHRLGMRVGRHRTRDSVPAHDGFSWGKSHECSGTE